MTLDIAAIKARADKATAGRWIADGTPDNCIVWQEVGDNRICFMAHSNGRDEKRDIATAAFIAHARTDIPDLLAALEASEAARVKAEQALWELDAVGCDFGYYEQAAKTMKSIVDKAIDGLLKQPAG